MVGRQQGREETTCSRRERQTPQADSVKTYDRKNYGAKAGKDVAGETCE